MSFSGFKKPSAGGKFFKPADHVNDLAVLVEAKSVQENQRNEYEGKVSYRDLVTADITIFGTQESIEKREPTEILKGSVLSNTALVNEAKENIGQPLLAQVRKIKNYYAFKADYSPDIEEAVAEYYQAREKAVADAVADAPGFD